MNAKVKNNYIYIANNTLQYMYIGFLNFNLALISILMMTKS